MAWLLQKGRKGLMNDVKGEAAEKGPQVEARTSPLSEDTGPGGHPGLTD